MNGFDYFEQHPEQAAVFNAAMAESTLRVGRALVEAYDFTPWRSVVDVGGGNGALLAIVLSAFVGLGGTVFDLPSGCADAQRRTDERRPAHMICTTNAAFAGNTPRIAGSVGVLTARLG